MTPSIKRNADSGFERKKKGADLHLLEKERATFAEFFPKLDETLAQIPLLEMEKPDNPAIGIFRKFAGPKLLIPTKFSGLGATPLQAIHIQRALGSRSPSLAVATTMHHWSVAIILEMFAGRTGASFETQWLENIAENNLYVSSAFAEGIDRKSTRLNSSHQTISYAVFC